MIALLVLFWVKKFKWTKEEQILMNCFKITKCSHERVCLFNKGTFVLLIISVGFCKPRNIIMGTYTPSMLVIIIQDKLLNFSWLLFMRTTKN